MKMMVGENLSDVQLQQLVRFFYFEKAIIFMFFCSKSSKLHRFQPIFKNKCQPFVRSFSPSFIFSFSIFFSISISQLTAFVNLETGGPNDARLWRGLRRHAFLRRLPEGRREHPGRRSDVHPGVIWPPQFFNPKFMIMQFKLINYKTKQNDVI